jgi:hypothetical protein
MKIILLPLPTGYTPQVNPQLTPAVKVKVIVKVTLQLRVSQLSLGVEPQILLPFDSYGLVFCEAPSLTRGQVCLLYMLLALACTVFLWSKSPGTHNHILLSQIWDFPFCHLLRLAGSRWRYSTPPPHRYDSCSINCLQDYSSAWTTQKTATIVVQAYLPRHCIATSMAWTT